MSLSDELGVCCNEELKGVVNSIFGCMRMNIWGCSIWMIVGVAWLILGKGYNVCVGHGMRLW